MDILKTLEQEFKLKPFQVENTVSLIDEGNTIPFIARYRKEMTGSLDDETLRNLYERLVYLRNLEEKRESVKNSIIEQEKMTDEIAKALDNAKTVTEIDDIYRPFRPKRRTRATIAVEKGLEPLATLIRMQQVNKPVVDEAVNYVNAEKGVEDADEAIAGAMDIIAESISDEAEYRAFIRKMTFDKGTIVTKGDSETESVFEMYYDYSEPVSKIPGHRILAINRGEKEKVLSVKLEAPVEDILKKLESKIIVGNKFTDDILKETIADSYKRLIAPAIEREIRNDLTEKAEEGAIKVFGANLKQLLLQPPIKDMVVLALDPGFRNGCKVAVVDGTGKVLDHAVVYPVPPVNKVAQAKKILSDMIKKNGVNIIAIGNGTASRETELFAVELMKELNLNLQYIMVNEAGASVYSASKLATEEFPDFDVAQRSAVSIARRVQDPLAELVKIDPKSIGVGQYQHDMNQKKLENTLTGVVEDSVNKVGVDLNTASASLLEYISGISKAVAKNIVEYRETNGRFTNRKQLLKVAKLGPKAFEQCAGFMRISGGDNPLDATSVHPESYEAATKLLALLGYDINSITSGELIGLKSKVKDFAKMADELGIGTMTLEDIVKELEKPGRDPRDEMPKPILRKDVLDMKDLTPGMILKGTVRNVIDFGAFVDIGVHQDGLVHISQMSSTKRVEHPLDVVSVGDIVDVRVIDVDIPKARISLSMILDEKEAANRKYTKDNSNNKNNRNNGKGNRQDRKPKKEGLNLSGLAKFMH